MNKTFLWLIVIVVVIVAGALFFNRGYETEDTVTPPGAGPVSGAPPSGLVAPTGNVDDVVASILSEVASDELTPEESDSSLTAPENFGDLDQSLDTSSL